MPGPYCTVHLRLWGFGALLFYHVEEISLWSEQGTKGPDLHPLVTCFCGENPVWVGATKPELFGKFSAQCQANPHAALNSELASGLLVSIELEPWI